MHSNRDTVSSSLVADNKFALFLAQCFQCWQSILPYCSVYFISLAYLQGYTLLAMPNSIAHTGIRPFVAISFLALITEIFAAFLFLIILQKAIALRANGFMYYQLKPVDDKLDENQEDLYDDSKINFHLISEMFLPIYLQVGFDLLCLVLFGVSEITNGLSGSQIFAVALHSSTRAVLPGFIWIGASLLIFMRRFLNRFIPVLSLIPLVILIVTVVCCLVVGNAIHNPIHSSWEYGASPLLIVLASLGGTARLMPYLVNFIQFERKSLIYFYLSIILAQITTTALNILWCYAVLSVVPQTCNEIPSSFLNESFTTGDQHCNLTLLWARDNGIIATTPLSLILYQYYPQFRWAAVLVVLFVFMTTIISYLTAGLPLMTLITGINESFWKKYTSLVQKTQEQSDEDLLTNSAAERQRVWMCFSEVFLQILVFLAIYLICHFGVQNFYNFANYASALTSLLFNGLFIPILFYYANSSKLGEVEVPLAVPGWLRFGALALMLIYFFMTIIDILMVAKVIKV